jgi:hypothetical protein
MWSTGHLSSLLALSGCTATGEVLTKLESPFSAGRAARLAWYFIYTYQMEKKTKLPCERTEEGTETTNVQSYTHIIITFPYSQ